MLFEVGEIPTFFLEREKFDGGIIRDEKRVFARYHTIIG